MSATPQGTIKITKAAIRRRKLARRVQGDFAYHAYGLATQACVVLMSSGIVFSLVGLKWGVAGNAALAACAMALIGFVGARAVFSATHRDYGGVLLAGAGVTGLLGMLVGENIAAGWADAALATQLSRDFLAVVLGTGASVAGALAGRALQGSSVWGLLASAFARRGKPVEPVPAGPKPGPAPAPLPRSRLAQPIVSPNVAVTNAEDGDICPICTDQSNRIRPGDLCVTCPECAARHHPECWDQNGGCGALHQTR